MSAASLTLTALGAMVLGCVVVGGLGQLAGARASLDASADLGALAVAGRVVRGEPAASACAVGASVVAADGARLLGCTVEGHHAVVVVGRDVQLLGWTASLESSARAGPGDGPVGDVPVDG